jgi:hypothetical protein
VLTLEGINEMPNSDWKLVNTGSNESYELKHWLDKNEYSTCKDNFDTLSKVIGEKIKKGHSDKIIKWSELDSALNTQPHWFSDLAPMVHQK